jgi:hypothetical protein
VKIIQIGCLFGLAWFSGNFPLPLAFGMWALIIILEVVSWVDGFRSVR